MIPLFSLSELFSISFDKHTSLSLITCFVSLLYIIEEDSNRKVFADLCLMIINSFSIRNMKIWINLTSIWLKFDFNLNLVVFLKALYLSLHYFFRRKWSSQPHFQQYPHWIMHITLLQPFEPISNTRIRLQILSVTDDFRVILKWKNRNFIVFNPFITYFWFFFDISRLNLLNTKSASVHSKIIPVMDLRNCCRFLSSVYFFKIFFHYFLWTSKW